MVDKKYIASETQLRSVVDGNDKVMSYLRSNEAVIAELLNGRSIWATALRYIAENIGTDFEFEHNEEENIKSFGLVVDSYPKENDSTKWTIKISVIYPDESDVVREDEIDD